MPLKRCKINGESGWKWGSSGTCYKSKRDAIRQAIAIEGAERFKEIMQSEKTSAEDRELIKAALADHTDDNSSTKPTKSKASNKYIESVELYVLERTYGYISEKKRESIPDEDFAGPNRTYPCDTLAHFKSACKLFGRAANPEQVKKNLIKIAKRKGYSLPEKWKDEDASSK